MVIKMNYMNIVKVPFILNTGWSKIGLNSTFFMNL